MAEDHIRYDILAQEAMRSVMRKVLEETARSGLPGDHHFFITFDTGFPGVRLSRRMVERYPEEMTIVIQHMFWDLDVGETAFEIDLSFDDTRERLRVPYAAIRGFFDPSVKFGLQFDVPARAGEKTAVEAKPKAGSVVPAVKANRSEPSEKETIADKTKPEKTKSAKNKTAAAEVVSLELLPQEMSGAELVNLRLARKRKRRQQAEAKAEANRIRSSVPAAQRRAEAAEIDRAEARHQAHRIEAPMPERR